MRIGLAIIAKNESQGVRAVIPRVPIDSVDELIAVDGGSADGTREYLEGRGFRVLVQRRGDRSAAVRMAWEATRADALVFFSPDGNEAPEDLPRFRPLLEQGYDLVIASRILPGGCDEEDIRLLKPRKWASRSFTWLANRLWNNGPRISDPSNGLRAITRTAWERLCPDAPSPAMEFQTSIRAMKLDLRVAEFPTKEGQRIGGRTSAPSIPTGLAYLRVLAREWRREPGP